MRKNIDNNIDQDGIDDTSMNKMSDKELAKKFDDQMDKLKKIAKDEDLDNKNIDADSMINELFEKGNEHFNDKIEKSDELVVQQKYKVIEERDIDVQKAIIDSGNSVLSEITDWQKQKNPVAKGLLKISNWILKSEKI